MSACFMASGNSATSMSEFICLKTEDSRQVQVENRLHGSSPSAGPGRTEGRQADNSRTGARDDDACSGKNSPKTSQKISRKSLVSKTSETRPYPKGQGKVRRLQANARERKRMHGLKEAFDVLREHLPAWGDDRQMSKYDTLLMAQTYIVRLQQILTDQSTH